MSYEIFSREIRRSTIPRVTLSKLGRFSFNAAATRILEENAVEQALLMWDKEGRKVGIRSLTKKDPRAYKLNYTKESKGAGFAAKPFLQHIGYDCSETRAFPCDWNEAETMYEIELPQEAFKTVQRFPRLSGKEAKGESEAKRHVRTGI